MELGGVNRAAAVTTNPVVNQQTAPAGERSAAPDLPPEKTVQAVSSADVVDVQISDDAATSARRLEFLRQVIARRVEVDPETRQILFQAVRQRTGEIVQQTPTEASLKLRAYLAAEGIDGRKRAHRAQEEQKISAIG